MVEAQKLMAEIDEANRNLDALRKSRRGMLGSYRRAERQAQAYIGSLWSQWRALNTDVATLPQPPR